MGKNSRMIEKFYSKVDPNKLLHIVHRLESVSKRVNIIPEEHFLQCSFMCLEKNQTFQAHKHIEKSRSYSNQIAQESWIVIKGQIKSIFYDIDDSLLTEVILNPGDASFTLYGGHNYLIMQPDTVVYEYKTGPYEGQALDKEFLK
jgi:cupin fold WbuC family metalloprotein